MYEFGIIWNYEFRKIINYGSIQCLKLRRNYSNFMKLWFELFLAMNFT